MSTVKGKGPKTFNQKHALAPSLMAFYIRSARGPTSYLPHLLLASKVKLCDITNIRLGFKNLQNVSVCCSHGLVFRKV